WEAMREHPAIGSEIVSTVPGLEHLAPAILAEHERWDGGGYPRGLRGEEIPVASRIAFVCDAFHAMTSDRPYRRAMPVGDALAEIEREAGGQFCPRAAAALLAVAA
ncbi:MAG TPA: HD domain-containing phosphohydrolase, partial [Gaiellaceae bacterium]|nr:HD domain-containing phosphohydrolase [Gaiellaceae bacterium]